MYRSKTHMLMLISVVFAALSVILGAFAAHGLQGVISEKDCVIFQTGVQYMMWHALATMIYIVYTDNIKQGIGLTCWFFVGGIFLFSGSLFVIALTSISWVGMITPIGGLCFIIGWLVFFWDILKIRGGIRKFKGKTQS